MGEWREMLENGWSGAPAPDYADKKAKRLTFLNYLEKRSPTKHENGKSFSHRLPLCEFANSARAVEKGKREWGRSTLADMKT